MTVASSLLEILVCPEDKGPLWYIEDEQILYNERSKRRYEVRNGIIPVLLVDESKIVDDSEHERLLSKTAGSVRTGSDSAKED